MTNSTATVTTAQDNNNNRRISIVCPEQISECISKYKLHGAYVLTGLGDQMMVTLPADTKLDSMKEYSHNYDESNGIWKNYTKVIHYKSGGYIENSCWFPFVTWEYKIQKFFHPTDNSPCELQEFDMEPDTAQ